MKTIGKEKSAFDLVKKLIREISDQERSILYPKDSKQLDEVVHKLIEKNLVITLEE